MKNKVFKIISRVLVVAMIATVGFGFTGSDAKAAADVKKEVVFSATKMAVGDYWDADETQRTAPINPGYVFGGWYSADNEQSAIKDMTGVTEAYAKWVPAQVLSVKTQVSPAEGDTNEVTASSNNVSLRIVSSVDSKNYQSVGFLITAKTSTGKNGKWQTADEFKTKVYKNFTADNNPKTAAEVFDSESEFFFAKGITTIPTAEFVTSFLATPYWVTLDGTKVEGLAKYVHVEDYYNNLISVPVYLNSDDVQAAAGILSLTYDTTNLKYHDFKNGVLFEEGMAAAQGDVVKCVANVATLGNKPANGMFINLRFKLTDTALTNNKTQGYTFDITANASEFCNVDEVLISELDTTLTIDPCDIYY